jgi:hypothetical protein
MDQAYPESDCMGTKVRRGRRPQVSSPIGTFRDILGRIGDIRSGGNVLRLSTART